MEHSAGVTVAVTSPRVGGLGPSKVRPRATESLASPFESIDINELDAITGGCACGCGQASCGCANGSCGQGATAATPATATTNPYRFQYRWGR